MKRRNAKKNGDCRLAAIGVAICLLGLIPAAQAAAGSEIEFTGYMRGGAASGPSGLPRGGYSLGGETQKFRLGNEGDNGVELGLGKTFDMGSNVKWGVHYMPAAWGGTYTTAQAYTTMSGLDFAPEATFWAGQRRLRIQDVHIVDRFLMDYGDNTGAGMTGYRLGFAQLAVGVFTGGTFDNNSSAINNATRVNVDLSEIQSNPGGKLRVLGTLVRGDFQVGSAGGGLSVSHNQADFLLAGMNNTVFVQTASGHAALSGQFQTLGATAPGMQSLRIADAINWQFGALGGQALAAYQSGKVEGGANNGKATRDLTLGGRVSYAVGRHFKWLAEAGTTTREVDGQPRQSLNKITIAPTLALAPEFWSRPELRFYLTQVSWNAAAASANAASFGAGGRTSATLAGAQIEAWW